MIDNTAKQLTSFFDNLEKVLFNVTAWVIVIPVTLYRVVVSPKAMSQQVAADLEAGGAVISPVYLYLLAALGPFLFTQLYEFPRVELEGDSVTVQGAPVTFYFAPDQSALSKYVRVDWLVSGADSVDIPICYWNAGAVIDCDDPFILFDAAIWETRSVDRAVSRVDSAWADEGVAKALALLWCGWEGGSALNQPYPALRSPYDPDPDPASPPPWLTRQQSRVSSWWAWRRSGCSDSEADRVLTAAHSVLQENKDDVLFTQFDLFADTLIPAPWRNAMIALHVSFLWPYFDFETDESAPDRLGNLFVDRATATQPRDLMRGAAKTATEYPTLAVEAAAEAIRYCYGTTECPPLNRMRASLSDRELRVLDKFLSDSTLTAEEDLLVRGISTGPLDSVRTGFGAAWADALETTYCRVPPARMQAGCPDASGWRVFQALAARYSSADSARKATAAYLRSTSSSIAPLADSLAADSLAEKYLKFWCAKGLTAEWANSLDDPAFGIGCPPPQERCAVDERQEPTESDGEENDTPREPGTFFLVCSFDKPGSYVVTARLTSSITNELLDLSEAHPLLVTASDSLSSAGSRAPGSTYAAREENAQTLKDMLQATQTWWLAAVLLLLPLSLAATAVASREDEAPLLETIKRPFYIECLLMAPFVLSVWIRILRGRYADVLQDTALLSLNSLSIVLIVALLVWLLVVQIDFIVAERNVSRRRATLYLLIPVIPLGAGLTAVLDPEMVAWALAGVGLTKFHLVTLVGYALITLLSVPLLIKIGASATRIRRSGTAGPE